MIELSKPRPKLWTPEDLAEFLSVPVGWIYRHVRKTGPEMIPHIKLGKYLRFDPESSKFQQWLASHESGGESAGGVSDALTLEFPMNRVRATEKTGQVG